MKQVISIQRPIDWRRVGVLTAAAIVCLAFAFARPAEAQLRIASYNTNGGPNKVAATDAQTLFAAMGAASAAGIARPVDVLLLQEQDSAATDVQAFVDELNSIYGAGVYARGVLDGAVAVGSPRQGVVYNAQTVTLLEEVAVGTVSSSANARQAMRYKFRPVGYDAASDFYVYNSHYKAGDFASDRNRRHAEAMSTRVDADALGEGAHIIYAGDFNIGTNLELMWGALTGAGNGQAIDPTNPSNATQFWGESSGFKHLHTQSPVKTARFSGQVTGGMDDRFDFQIASGEFLDGEGLSYIDGTYRSFGNNGTHPLNGELDDPSNTAQSGAVLTAIANESDHLPVVVDYQLPAKMSAALGSLPSRVLVGASVDVDVSVTNNAPVATANGADELDFVVTTSGALSGGATGVALAATSASVNAVQLDTSSAGAKAGDVEVVSGSQQVVGGLFEEGVTFDVVDHAQPSFDAGSEQASLTIDLGIVALNANPVSQAAAVYNREATVGFTADLDLDVIDSSGDADRLTIDLQPFSNLPAGGASNFSAMLATDQIGSFDATYLLSISDEDLPGEVTGQMLTIDLVGEVALAGDADLDGDVDTADITTAIINFTGASGGGKDWATGDNDGDGDVDTADITAAITAFTGASALPGDGVLTAPTGDFDPFSEDLVDILSGRIKWSSVDPGRGVDEIARVAAILSGGMTSNELTVLSQALYWQSLRNREGTWGGLLVPEPTAAAGLLLLLLGVRRRRPGQMLGIDKTTESAGESCAC